MNEHIILGVHITDRVENVDPVQHTLTEYGCNIKTRVGIHEAEQFCSPNGLILLELFGDKDKCLELEQKLKDIEGVDVKKMVFEYD